MALDERDYMQTRARQLVERDYYGWRPRSHRERRGLHWSLMLIAWLALTVGLWLLHELAAA